jgi:hypothetical protein
MLLLSSVVTLLVLVLLAVLVKCEGWQLAGKKKVRF